MSGAYALTKPTVSPHGLSSPAQRPTQGSTVQGFGRARQAQAPIARARWSPDLGNLGSPVWWRDLFALVTLFAILWPMRPDLRPLPAAIPTSLQGQQLSEARAQTIGPSALGSRTGRRKPATGLVLPIATAPERALVQTAVAIGFGDTLAAALTRNGASVADVQAAAALIAGTAGAGGIAAGTMMTVKLGRRLPGATARPIDRIAVRVRFDLALTVERRNGQLVAMARPIAIDTTPLRIAGVAGPSLYRATRAAGATAGEAEAFIKALAARLSFAGDVAPADGFAMVVERQRASTGETRLGELLLARLDQPGRRTELVRWSVGGQEGWFDADGRFERRGAVGMPVAGHITSGFGMRFHPLLGFSRMHKGIDIGAPVGTPVIAVVAGTVQSAGWSGGYGNFIRLEHGPGFATGYGHLSRIAVTPGQQVARGEVIGFVGSTGLSTGPHLHWEIWRNGVAIDPMTLSMDSISTLDVRQLAAFRAAVARLRAIGG